MSSSGRDEEPQESSKSSKVESVTKKEGTLGSGSGDIPVDTSSLSPSPLVPDSESGGGVGALRFCFPCRVLDLRDKMDPAHVLTFFCFLVRFLHGGFCPPSSSTCCLSEESDTWLAGHAEIAVAVSFCDSAELTLTGRERVGEAATKGSKPKKDHFLLDFVGLGVAGAMAAVRPAGGMEPRKGIDPLLLGEGRDCSCSSVCVRSRIAPAVLGRDSFNLRAELNPTGE